MVLSLKTTTVRFWITDDNLGAATEPFTIRVRMNLLTGEIIGLAVLLLLGVVAAIFGLMSRKRKVQDLSHRRYARLQLAFSFRFPVPEAFRHASKPVRAGLVRCGIISA